MIKIYDRKQQKKKKIKERKEYKENVFLKMLLLWKLICNKND